MITETTEVVNFNGNKCNRGEVAPIPDITKVTKMIEISKITDITGLIKMAADNVNRQDHLGDRSIGNEQGK